MAANRRWCVNVCVNGWMRGKNCKALWIKALYKCSPFTIYHLSWLHRGLNHQPSGAKSRTLATALQRWSRRSISIIHTNRLCGFSSAPIHNWHTVCSNPAVVEESDSIKEEVEPRLLPASTRVTITNDCRARLCVLASCRAFSYRAFCYGKNSETAWDSAVSSYAIPVQCQRLTACSGDI